MIIQNTSPEAFGIKAVCFDFGQTLVDSAEGFKAAEKDAQQTIFSQFKLPDWDRFLDVYRKIRKSLHEQSQFSRRVIWSTLLKALECEPNTEVLTELEQHYWQTVQRLTQPFPEAESVLSALSGRYRLGLITNTQGESNSGQHRIHRFPQLRDAFQSMIVAGQDPIPAKPNSAPFQKVLQELGVPPGAAVYVGDDYRIDIVGAGKVGMHPIWLKHRLVRRNWPCNKAMVPVIDSLEPLCRLEELV